MAGLASSQTMFLPLEIFTLEDAQVKSVFVITWNERGEVAVRN